MITANLIKLELTGIYCDGDFCKKTPEYFNKIIGDVYHIKPGTLCLHIFSRSSGLDEIYCTDCIDELYKILKPVLDKKLWAFH